VSEPPAIRQVCALLRGGRVLTDHGRLPAYDAEHAFASLARRVGACGDPAAVPVAPQLQVHADPQVLLDVFASRVETAVAGTWTTLDDVREDAGLVSALRDVAAVAGGDLAAPARRPDWFATSWYDEVEAWVDTELRHRGRRRTGPAEPAKVWSLSAVLRIPCDGAPVWFKASCRHFHAEPALTRLVAEMLPEHAPPIIATDDDRAWTLLEEMPGADDLNEDEPPPGLSLAAARIAATIQLRSLDHLPEIEAAGVPVRHLTSTLHQLDEVLLSSVELDELTAEELAAARATRTDMHAVVAELDSLGIPDTLVHGDLHSGNVAHDDDALVLYDWSDAAVSHPFLDVVRLTEREPDDQRDAARAVYAEAWRTAYPEADVDRALELAVPTNTIYQMVTFEQIYQAQEDASYWEMRGVVARMLRSLPERIPRRPGAAGGGGDP